MSDLTREPRALIPSFEPFYEFARPFSWLLLRMGVGLILAIHGFGKIGRLTPPVALIKVFPGLESIGTQLTISLMVIEFIGGIAIMIGVFTRFFAAAAAVEMGVLTFIIYWNSGFSWLSRGYEFTLLWGLMCFAIALRGGGPYSLDRRIGKEL